VSGVAGWHKCNGVRVFGLSKRGGRMDMKEFETSCVWMCVTPCIMKTRE
jgi:hypothetical protein